MSENKAASPQKIAILGVGSVAALGVAFWTISNAIGPAPVPHPSPTPSPPPTTGGSSTTGGSPAAPTNLGALPGSAVDLSSRRDTTSAAPASAGAGQRLPITSEAALAPEANPFVPLPTRTIAQSLAGPTGANQAPVAGNQTGRGGPGGTALPRSSRWPSLNPGLGGPLPTDRRQLPPMPVPAPPAPELVGTLLGDRPSAVFRGASQLVAVPLGATFGGWKVVDVSQGTAIVKRMGRIVRLQAGVAAPSSEPSAPRGALPTASPRESMALRETGPDSSFAPQTTRATPESAETSVTPLSRTRPAADGLSSGDTMPTPTQQDALPALPDTPLTSEGRPVPLPDDSSMNAEPVAPSQTTPAPRPAVAGGYRPFRRLVALEGDPLLAPALPSVAVEVAAPIAPAVKPHAAHRHLHHRLRRHRHRHHRHAHHVSHSTRRAA